MVKDEQKDFATINDKPLVENVFDGKEKIKILYVGDC